MQLSTPHRVEPLLLGLAVFQNRQNLENVRSVHIYKEESCLHTIQQEFQSKAGALEEICPPIFYACLCEGSTLVKEYMEHIMEKQRRAGWQCLLDFCSTPQRISHSSLTEKELLVANAWSLSKSLIINADNAEESCARSWERSPHILPSISACLKAHDSFEHVVSDLSSEELTDAVSQRLQLDLWHQWGSDLELASPRLSITFKSPLPGNHVSNESKSVFGDMSNSLSSSLSSNNVDSFPWMIQNGLGQSPKMADIITGTQSDEMFGANIIGVANTRISSQSTFETLVGESSTNCKIFADVLPLDLNQMALVNAMDPPGGNKRNGYCDHSIDCDTSQPMSSASNTYSSGDERGLEAEILETLDGIRELKAGSVRKAKSKAKLHKTGSSRAGSRRLSKLTKAELAHYFNMPITQASKELNVGLTVLKKCCRIFGIPRWPHRKMKSINGLIQNIQDLVKTDISGDNGKESNQVQVAVEELEKQKKELQECPSIQLPERTKRLRQACFKASYRKRRQAVHEHGVHDHHDHQNAPTHISYNNCSMFFYPHCDLRVGAPFCPK